MTFRHCVAVDLGASSGRVMLARYDSEHRTLTLREIHRFVNCLQKTDGFDTWDIDSLENDIRLGLKKVCDEGIRIDSIGIDTWGVDYVLIDNVGQRVGMPVSYRDSRTTGIMAQAMTQPGKGEIYRRSGIQFLPFNTLYQLRALVEQQPELLPQVAHALLIPDYFSFRLTGKMNWEYTNATTTQLVNINTDDWDDTLLAWTGADKAWFGRPTHPGNVIGHWICPQKNQIPVVAVASHDTASAVIASPLADKNSAYLSSGTWSLMGFEKQNAVYQRCGAGGEYHQRRRRGRALPCPEKYYGAVAAPARIKRAPDFRPANAYQPNASAAGLSIPDKPERRPLYQPRRYECRNSGSMP